MALLEDYLEIDGEAIQIKGYRIGLETLVREYHNGATAEDMARDYGLPLESIYAALAYYLRHQSDVDAYVARIEADSEAAYRTWTANPPEIVRRLQAVRDQQHPSQVA